MSPTSIDAFAAPETRLIGSVGRAGRGAVVAYALAIVYASLNPFFGWRPPEAFTLFVWPRYLNGFDVVINVLAYVPLGGMLAGMHLSNPSGGPGSATPMHAWWRAVGFATLLSATMETLQSFLPVRVASPVDLLTNAAGAAAGAAVVVSTAGRHLLARVMAWRRRHFNEHSETGWGLLLLVAWFFAQLNPVIPFFEAGHIVNPFDLAATQNPYDPLVLLPQAVGISLNVCGFALLLSLLLRPSQRAIVDVLLILALGFVIKVSTAALMLKAPQMVAWLAPATVIGLSSGVLLFAAFSRIGYRWRAFCATLFIFAGGLMAKMTSVYGAFDETLRLLSWPQGHIASFAGLTRWVHEIWPLLAFVLAAWVFVRHRQSHWIE